MDRRNFLGTLMAIVAGLAIAPADLLWKPAELPDLPPLLPGSVVTLDQMTREVARLLAERAPRPVINASRLGDAGMCRLRSVEAGFPVTMDANGLDYERYVRPVALALAHDVDRLGCGSYGQLPVPTHGVLRACVVSGCDVSVRSRVLWHPGLESHMLRFDILTS